MPRSMCSSRSRTGGRGRAGAGSAACRRRAAPGCRYRPGNGTSRPAWRRCPSSRPWRPSGAPARRCRREPPPPPSWTRTPSQRMAMHHRCRRAAAGLCVATLEPGNDRRRYPTMQDVLSPEVLARVRTIRARLPGQMLHERLQTAQLTYGPLYTLAEIRQRVGEVLPRRLGYVRSAVLERIESYREAIPAHALVKYDDAVQSGLFEKFWVVTPTYYQERQVDPWIVAEVGGADRWAVIARWD